VTVSLVGVNHKCSPVSLRESLAVVGAQAALSGLLEQGWQEAVVLSTCNRFEIYAVNDRPKSLEDLALFLDRLGDAPVSSYAYRRFGLDAVRHLFNVSSGLDSLVLGEGEILGQVKQAYEMSRQVSGAGKLTHVLFQRALHVGKAVRSRTHIGVGQISVASVAVELARRIFGDLDHSEVLILGAGKMAEKVARHLKSARVRRLILANRTLQKASALASEIQAQPISWQDFPKFLSQVDIVVSSTGSVEPVVTKHMVSSILPFRRGRSLFFIDIAMPRDVTEEVHGIDGIYLYHLQDLQAIVDENVSQRSQEIAAAREIIDHEVEQFGLWLKGLSRHGVPLQHSTLKTAASWGG
jgi:glutamyl-tRNA reductase